MKLQTLNVYLKSVYFNVYTPKKYVKINYPKTKHSYKVRPEPMIIFQSKIHLRTKIRTPKMNKKANINGTDESNTTNRRYMKNV